LAFLRCCTCYVLPDGAAPLHRLSFEESLVDESFAKSNAEGIVDVEKGDGRAADGCATNEVSASPAKMPGPFVPTRVEQWR
jgi:hypothetical protein